MRKLSLVVVLSVMVVTVVFVPVAGGASKSPVDLDGKVNVHGKANVSKQSKGSLDVVVDDYYFAPTFIKVAAGQKVTIKLDNEGTDPHTFTSDELGVDKEVGPGKSAKVKVRIPSDVEAVQYFCQFHDSLGMQGAFYAASGATASPGANSGSSSGTDSGGYGY
jgi:plastocyanin